MKNHTSLNMKRKKRFLSLFKIVKKSSRYETLSNTRTFLSSAFLCLDQLVFYQKIENFSCLVDVNLRFLKKKIIFWSRNNFLDSLLKI